MQLHGETGPERVRFVRRTSTARWQAEQYAAKGYGYAKWPSMTTPGWKAEFQGRCEKPLTMRQHDDDDETEWTKGFRTDTLVRCRQCERCLRYRRTFWATRMVAECMSARRSWFVTLTVRNLAALEYLARLKAEQDTLIWKEAPTWVKARYVFSELGKLVQLYMKRLRSAAARRAKQQGHEAPKLRYALVFEHGDTGGRPHAHLLLHEVGKTGVTKRMIQEHWEVVGFSNCKLVRDPAKGAWYAAKYLAKSLSVRMRASLRYGGMVDASAFTGPMPAHGIAVGDPAREANSVIAMTSPSQWSAEGVAVGAPVAKTSCLGEGALPHAKAPRSDGDG